MSHDESSAIDRLSQIIRWLVGGILSLLLGAAAVGGWVALQEQSIKTLQESDQQSLIDRSKLHGKIEVLSDSSAALRQDMLLQNRDLLYIRQSVEKIEKAISKP